MNKDTNKYLVIQKIISPTYTEDGWLRTPSDAKSLKKKKKKKKEDQKAIKSYQRGGWTTKDTNRCQVLKKS